MTKKLNQSKSSFASRTFLTLILAASPAVAWSASAPFSVREQLVKAGQGLTLDTLVIAPDKAQDQAFPLVVMNHGFLLSQQYYRDVLTKIAQEGFVVIAPQAYAPGGLPFGKPTTTVEASKLSGAVQWFETRLEDLVDQKVDFNKLALISHSRGSKVAWTMVRDNMLEPSALIAIDPVDGTQDGSSRVTGDMQLDIPALIIGTGLGGKGGGAFSPACAPLDANHQSFWPTATTSPSYLFVASNYGHMDFLDEQTNCGLICKVCSTAPKENKRVDFRNFIAKRATNFLRSIFYKDQQAITQLNSPADNEIKFTSEKR